MDNVQLVQSAEEKYRLLFNLIDEGFFIIDIIFDENDRPVDMYYVEANNAATKMLGIDFAGKRLRDIDSNYEEYWFEIFGNIALTGQSIRMEQYAEPDKKWYSFYIFRIGDKTSRRIGNIFLDITESKQAAEALRESEQLYRALFENTEDGFVVVQPIFDESGHSNNYIMVNMNQAWAKQTGLKPNDFIGKTIKETMPGVESSWPEAFANVKRTGESVHFESFNHISNRWYDVYAFNYRGGLVGVLFRDISERKNIEVALRKSEERQVFLLKLSDALRQLADTNDIQSVSARLLGEHLGANQVHYGETVGGNMNVHQGYNNGLQPMIGSFHHMHFGERSVAAYRAGQTAVCYDVTTDLTITTAEAMVITGSGFQAYIAVPLIKDGQWVATLTVQSIEPRAWKREDVTLIEDVTQRIWAAVERARVEEALRRSEEQTRQLLKTKDEFLATCSHELRTPLTVIMANLELLTRMYDKLDPRHREKQMNAIHRNAKQLNTLVSDLLDYSRLETGHLTMDMASLDIGQLLVDTVSGFNRSCATHSVRLASEVVEARIHGDDQRLQQILNNLLSNAVRYSKEGTTIIVTSTISDRTFIVSVSDQGRGISEEQLPMLFDRYYRTPEEVHTSGMGLGLYIASEIVHLHGGTIEVESKVMKGSTFTVKLPLAVVEPAPGMELKSMGPRIR